MGSPDVVTLTVGPFRERRSNPFLTELAAR